MLTSALYQPNNNNSELNFEKASFLLPEFIVSQSHWTKLKIIQTRPSKMYETQIFMLRVDRWKIGCPQLVIYLGSITTDQIHS